MDNGLMLVLSPSALKWHYLGIVHVSVRMRCRMVAFLSLSLLTVDPGFCRSKGKLEIGKGKLDIGIDDLGFSKKTLQVDPELDATLQARAVKLDTHEKLGLITILPMLATHFTVSGIDTSRSKRDVHSFFSLTSAVCYFGSAASVRKVPKVGDGSYSGATMIHRALAFVHLPAMILTPLLGLQARWQLDSGKDVHGLAKFYRTTQDIATVTMLASVVVVSLDF